MHVFPSGGNQERERVRRQWTLFVKRHLPDFQPSSSSHLCSAHFEQSAFTTNLSISVGIGIRRNLKPGAIPTIDVAGVMASLESTQQLTDREKRQVRSRLGFVFYSKHIYVYFLSYIFSEGHAPKLDRFFEKGWRP